MNVETLALSQEYCDALHSGRHEAIALAASSSSQEGAGERTMTAEHLRTWILSTSLCYARTQETEAHCALCYAWTSALLSWAACRLTRIQESNTDRALAAEECARYEHVLLPRARTILNKEGASLVTWHCVSEKLQGCSRTGTRRADAHTADNSSSALDKRPPIATDNRTACTLLSAALLTSHRDKVQPTWTPAAAGDYETAVTQQLARGTAPIHQASPVHCAALAPLLEWYAAQSPPCGPQTAPRALADQTSMCVEVIAYVMCRKIQSGCVTRCYAPLPFLLDATALTLRSSADVEAGLTEREGHYCFALHAMNGLMAAIRWHYDQQIRAVLKDFKKRSKSKAPPQKAATTKVVLPTYELLVTVIEPTMDVLRRERHTSEGSTVADVRASFATAFAALLRDWLRAVTWSLCATSSASVAKLLEAECAKWVQWIESTAATDAERSREQL